MPLFLRLRLPWFLALLALTLMTAATTSAQSNVLRWHDSLDRAASLSRESAKPLFVVLRCVR